MSKQMDTNECLINCFEMLVGRLSDLEVKSAQLARVAEVEQEIRTGYINTSVWEGRWPTILVHEKILDEFRNSHDPMGCCYYVYTNVNCGAIDEALSYMVMSGRFDKVLPDPDRAKRVVWDNNRLRDEITACRDVGIDRPECLSLVLANHLIEEWEEDSDEQHFAEIRLGEDNGDFEFTFWLRPKDPTWSRDPQNRPIQAVCRTCTSIFNLLHQLDERDTMLDLDLLQVCPLGQGVYDWLKQYCKLRYARDMPVERSKTKRKSYTANLQAFTAHTLFMDWRISEDIEDW